MIRAALVLCTAALAACAGRLGGTKAPREIVASFSCATGESLIVRFDQDRRVATLVRNGESAELQQQPSGSGYRYGNGWTNIRGKGRDLTLEVGKAAPLECKAQ